jgi:hypothetical protein
MLSPDLMLQAATAFRRLNANHTEGTDGVCTCCKEQWPCDVSVVIVTITQLMAASAEG